jgi:hypothetical protein
LQSDSSAAADFCAWLRRRIHPATCHEAGDDVRARYPDGVIVRRSDVELGDQIAVRSRELVPDTGTASRRRQRRRGDITDDEYLAAKRESETMLAAVPDSDKLVMFDRHRKVLESMAANLDRATTAQRQELVARLAIRIVARGRSVDPADIEWAGPVRPFFMLLEAPPDGFEPPTPALGRPRSIH